MCIRDSTRIEKFGLDLNSTLAVELGLAPKPKAKTGGRNKSKGNNTNNNNTNSDGKNRVRKGRMNNNRGNNNRRR